MFYVQHLSQINWEQSKGKKLLDKLKELSSQGTTRLKDCLAIQSQLNEEITNGSIKYLNTKEVLEEAKSYVDSVR